MANRYWVGGAGNWSSTTKWSTTSGGASGASVPGVGDTAIFDASSDSGANFTATVDSAVTVDNLTFTSVDRVITLGTAGNLTVSTATTISASAGTNGVTVSGNASLGAVTLTSGTLNIDGNTVTMSTFASTANTRTFNFGTTGTVTLTGSNATIWNITTTGTSTISGTGTVDCTYSGGTGTRTIVNSPDTGNSIPTFNISAGTDTVSFSGSSGVNSLNFTGFSGTWTNTAFSIFGSLTVSTGMTVGAGANTITMAATTSQTITTNGKTLDFPLTFDGVGGTWTLQDACTVGSTRTTTLTNGTLALGTNTLSTGLFSSDNTNTRSITFGSGSEIVITGSGAVVWNFDRTTNFSFTGTSLVEFTYSGGTGTRTIEHGNSAGTTAASMSFSITSGTDTVDINGGSYVRNLNFTGFSGTLTADAKNIFGDLTFSTGMTLTAGTGVTTFSSTGSQSITTNGKTLDFPVTFDGVGGTFTLQDNCTIGVTRTTTLTNGTLALGANTLSTGIFASDNSNTRAISFGTGKIELTYNIDSPTTLLSAATITNLTFSGTPLIEVTGTGTNVYTFAWGTTTGGSETNAVSISLLKSTACQYVLSGGYWKNITFNSSLAQMQSGSPNFYVYGNLTIIALSQWNASGGNPVFSATSGTQDITSAGKTLQCSPIINAPGATVRLQDAINIGTNRTLTITAGTFNANNYNVTVGTISSNNSNTRTITMGSGTWTLGDNGGTVWNCGTSTNLTVNANTSTMVLSNTGLGVTRTIAGGGKTYNNLTIGGGAGASQVTIFTGSNTFNTLASTKTVAHTVQFTAGTTTTVSDWTIKGTSGNVVTITSPTLATHTLTKSGGGVISGLDYLSISYSTATPGTTWYAGANSTDGGNNTGWIFTDAPVTSATNFFFMFGA